MRSSLSEPIVEALKNAQYTVEPNYSNPETGRVATLPVMGETMRSEEDVPLWEKVELAAFQQRWWSDNSVSATFLLLARAEEVSDV